MCVHVIIHMRYACVYTRGLLGTPTSSQHSIFDPEKTLTIVFIVFLAGFEPRVFGSRVRRSNNRATPSPQAFFCVAHVFSCCFLRLGDDKLFGCKCSVLPYVTGISHLCILDMSLFLIS